MISAPAAAIDSVFRPAHFHRRQRRDARAIIDERTGTTNLFNGDTRIYGVDFVYKWAPNGNPKYRNFKFVAEWFHRAAQRRR